MGKKTRRSKEKKQGDDVPPHLREFISSIGEKQELVFFQNLFEKKAFTTKLFPNSALALRELLAGTNNI